MIKKAGVLFFVVALAFGFSARGEAAESSKLSFDAGNDFTSSYYFRGLFQQNGGFITQPYANVYYQLTDSIKVWGGIWNSFHDQVAAGVDSPENWYELDALGGIELSQGVLTAGATYILYSSPSDAFKDIQEIELKVGFDDSALAKGSILPALNPSFAVAFEFDDDGGTEDTYAQVALEPSFEGKLGELPVSFSVPIVFGLSFDDWYTDKNGKNETFGYFSVGLSASTPLPFPGDWSLSASVIYLYLDAFSARSANSNQSSEVIGTVGISVSF